MPMYNDAKLECMHDKNILKMHLERSQRLRKKEELVHLISNLGSPHPNMQPISKTIPPTDLTRKKSLKDQGLILP